MAGLPTPEEVIARLDLVIGARCSPASRKAASGWATPLLIDNDEATIATEPPALGRALFLLGAADLLEQPPDTYVYGETDFVQARAVLSNE